VRGPLRNIHDRSVNAKRIVRLRARAGREAAFDGKLRAMAGAPEAGLLNGKGRIPDNSCQPEDRTRILQWRWDTSYIDAGMPPIYQRFGGWGGAGAAQGYRCQGAGCQKAMP